MCFVFHWDDYRNSIQFSFVSHVKTDLRNIFYMPDKRISFGLGPVSDLFLSFLQKYPEHAIYKVLHLMLRRGELQHRMQRKVLYRVK